MRVARMLSIVLLIAAGTSTAGMLELTNGARIPGELKAIEHDRVVWDADLIGEIKVEPAAIARLDGRAPAYLRVGSTDLPKRCDLEAQGRDLTFACPGQEPIAARWSEVGSAGRDREGTGKITTSLTLERGNSNKDEYELDARAKWRRAKLRHELDASVDYEEKRGDTTDDEASLSYQMDYVLRDDWYAYSRTRYERDRFDTVQEGIIQSFGIGRTWSFGPGSTLLVQGGPDIGHFDIQDIGRVAENGAELLWRVNHETRLWKFDVTLFHEGQYAWLLRDSDYGKLETSSGIDLPLLYGILAEIRVDYDRIGVNLPAVDNTDLEWVFSLGYKW